MGLLLRTVLGMLVTGGCLVTASGDPVRPTQEPKATATVGVPPAPRLLLSEVEQLRLEVVRLKQQLLELQYHNARLTLERDLQALVQRTLVDHGSPEGVVFDRSTFEFKGAGNATTQAPSSRAISGQSK